jgi:hypothetical protein
MKAYGPRLLVSNLTEVMLPKTLKAYLISSSFQLSGRFLTKMLLKTLLNSVLPLGAYLTPMVSGFDEVATRAYSALLALSKVMNP